MPVCLCYNNMPFSFLPTAPNGQCGQLHFVGTSLPLRTPTQRKQITSYLMQTLFETYQISPFPLFLLLLLFLLFFYYAFYPLRFFISFSVFQYFFPFPIYSISFLLMFSFQSSLFFCLEEILGCVCVCVFWDFIFQFSFSFALSFYVLWSFGSFCFFFCLQFF